MRRSLQSVQAGEMGRGTAKIRKREAGGAYPFPACLSPRHEDLLVLVCGRCRSHEEMVARSSVEPLAMGLQTCMAAPEYIIHRDVTWMRHPLTRQYRLVSYTGVSSTGGVTLGRGIRWEN